MNEYSFGTISDDVETIDANKKFILIGEVCQSNDNSILYKTVSKDEMRNSLDFYINIPHYNQKVMNLNSQLVDSYRLTSLLEELKSKRIHFVLETATGALPVENIEYILYIDATKYIMEDELMAISIELYNEEYPEVSLRNHTEINQYLQKNLSEINGVRTANTLWNHTSDNAESYLIPISKVLELYKYVGEGKVKIKSITIQPATEHQLVQGIKHRLELNADRYR